MRITIEKEYAHIILMIRLTDTFLEVSSIVYTPSTVHVVVVFYRITFRYEERD